MTNLSKHFSQSEFECRCVCKCEVIVSSDLITLLEGIRVSLGVPVRVTSGARCETHNAKVGGAKRSWHIPRNHTLYAADITYWNKGEIDKMGILKLYALADKHHASGLGLYPSWIHVDQRPTKRARWIDKNWHWTDGS